MANSVNLHYFIKRLFEPQRNGIVCVYVQKNAWGSKHETKASYPEPVCMKRVYLKKCCPWKSFCRRAREILYRALFTKERECPCDGVLLKFTLSEIYSHRATDKNCERKELIFSAPALFFGRARPSCECRSSHLCPINFAPIISARISQCRCLLGIQPLLSYALRLPFSPASLTLSDCFCAQTNLRQALYSVSPPGCLNTALYPTIFAPILYIKVYV